MSRQQAALCVLRRAHCILHVSSDTEQLTDVNTDNLHHIAQHNYSYFSVHIITLYWLTYPSKTRDLNQKLLVTTEFFHSKFYLFIKKRWLSFFLTLTVFIGLKSLQRTIKQSKGTTRQTSYLIMTVQRFWTLDIAIYLEFDVRPLLHSATNCSIANSTYVVEYHPLIIIYYLINCLPSKLTSLS